jgi:hypothetical protein
LLTFAILAEKSMLGKTTHSDSDGTPPGLIVRRTIEASARRLFDAWTEPGTRDQHENGWYGCLDGLERYLL